jgi:hypothetical protein
VGKTEECIVAYFGKFIDDKGVAGYNKYINETVDVILCVQFLGCLLYM